MRIKFRSPIVIEREKLNHKSVVEILCFKCGVKYGKKFGEIMAVNYCPNCEKRYRNNG